MFRELASDPVVWCMLAVVVLWVFVRVSRYRGQEAHPDGHIRPESDDSDTKSEA